MVPKSYRDLSALEDSKIAEILLTSLAICPGSRLRTESICDLMRMILACVTEQTHDIRVHTNVVGLFCDAG